MEANKLKELKLLCANVRIDILEMLMKFGQGHLGGSMSCVELFAVLYGKQLNVDPKNPKKKTEIRLFCQRVMLDQYGTLL